MILTEQAACFTVMEITLLIHHISKAKITAGPIAGNLSADFLISESHLLPGTGNTKPRYPV